MTEPGRHVSDRWAAWRRDVDLDEYHGRWRRLEASGVSSHGEADLIESLRPASVLDAGCGMGRVAIELARRGLHVEGIDLDADLLAYAQADAPHVRWHVGDLASCDLARTFDVVAMPGNVMLFCRVDQRADVVANMARHLAPGGSLVAGFSLERRRDAVTLDEYDALCAASGLVVRDRFATWDGDAYSGGDYAVSVHVVG